MSAYVVEPKTICRVLSYIHYGWGKADYTCKEIQRKLQKIEWDIENAEQLRDLGQAMYNLNINAVGQRYPDCTESGLPGSYSDKTDTLVRFKFKFEDCSLIQAYKSLQCWLYQCSEGDADQQRLYKTFDQIKDFLADRIVDGLPEYDKAEWN